MFLLNLEEVIKYFGDSRTLNTREEHLDCGWCKDKYWPWFGDQYNLNRRAVDNEGIVRHWTLRSPGANGHNVTFVMGFCGDEFDHGGINMVGSDELIYGHFMFDKCNFMATDTTDGQHINGVRPALWLKDIIIEVTPDDLPICSSFWNINDSRLIERKVFAYKIGDEYVGGCALFVRYEKCGHFSHFDVRNDLRGNGIGSRILEFTIKYFKDIGMEKMRLHVFKDNTAAIRLYERYGFEYTEDITPEKIVMIKTL